MEAFHRFTQTPHTNSGWPHLRVALSTLISSVLVLSVWVPLAAAHAELLQASPRANSVVGGAFHSIAMQFGGLDPDGNHRVELLDPAGVPMAQALPPENQRFVIPIDPLQISGTYVVSYTVIGEDGDITSGHYSFGFQNGAPTPEGLTLEYGAAERVGWFGYLVLLAGAGVLAFLVQRFISAIRQHRGAQAS